MIPVPPGIILEVKDHSKDVTIVKVTEDCYIYVLKKNLKNIEAIVNKALEDCDEEIEAEIEKQP